MNYRVNDKVKVKADKIASDYKAISKVDEYIFYTPFLLPGEEAIVNIEHIKGTTIHSSIVEILSQSKFRKNSKCPVFSTCGSCKLLHVDYNKTLDLKREAVEGIYKNARMNVKVNPVIGMENPYNYRNKVIASFSMKKGKIIYGMYEESSHDVVYFDSCRLQNEKLNEVLRTIRRSMENLKIKPEGFGGVLRHVLLRIGVKTGEIMVCLVTNQEMFPGRGELVKTITREHKDVKTVVQNINPRNTSVVLGEKNRILFGPGFIYDILLGNKYKISVQSFYQVNPVQTEKLYLKAIELANPSKDDVIIDAYSGIGTISMSVASRCRKTIGVEIVKSAVNDAIETSKENGIRNSRFFFGDAKEFLLNYDEKADILIIDPPRSGCDGFFIEALRKLKPKKVVYISCNPETQARDVSQLRDLYRIGDVNPVDMFPFTGHCEVITKLILK